MNIKHIPVIVDKHKYGGKNVSPVGGIIFYTLNE